MELVRTQIWAAVVMSLTACTAGPMSGKSLPPTKPIIEGAHSRQVRVLLNQCVPLVARLNDGQDVRDSVLDKLRDIAAFDQRSVQVAVEGFAPRNLQTFDRRGLVIYLLNRYMFNVPREVVHNGSGLMPGTPHEGKKWHILWPFGVSSTGELTLKEGFGFLPETGVDLVEEFRIFKKQYGVRKRTGHY